MQQSVAVEQKRERSNINSQQRSYSGAPGEVEPVSKGAPTARQAARDDTALHSQSLASHQRAASLTQELSATRANLEAVKAQLALEQNTASRATRQARAVADAKALRARAFEEQRQRADQLGRDLVLAQREVKGLKADAVVAARAQAATLAARQAAEVLANKQNKSLERERVKGAALEQEFLAARREIEQLKKSVQLAGAQRLDAVRSELAEAREELDAMRADLDAAKAQLALEQNTASRATAQARAVADTKAFQARALEEQQQRAERLARDLVLAQREVEGLKADAAIATRAKAATLAARQAAEDLANKQNKSAERERVKGAALEQEFLAARREIEQLKKSVQLVGDRRVDAGRSELAEAREELDAMRYAASAKAHAVADTRALQARALEEQRQRAERLALDLVLAQRQVEGLKTEAAIAVRAQAATLAAHHALEATLADTTRALEEERQTVKRFGHDLAAARQSIDALEVRANLAKASAAAALQARQVAEASAKRAGEAFAKERERAVLAVRDLDSAGDERDAANKELNRVSEELRAALEQEREKTVGLARDVSNARKEIGMLKDQAERRAARIEPAPNPRANSKPRVSRKASVRPVRQLRARETGIVEVRNPSRPVRMTTMRLPDILLPTRPPGPGLQ